MKKLILTAALCSLMIPAVAKDAKTTKVKSCCSMLSRTAMLNKSAKVQAISTANKTDKTAVYTVSGMTCEGCSKGLSAGLAKEKGVSEAKVDFKTKKATLRFDPKQTDVKKLEAAFARKGFPAKQVKS